MMSRAFDELEAALKEIEGWFENKNGRSQFDLGSDLQEKIYRVFERLSRFAEDGDLPPTVAENLRVTYMRKIYELASGRLKSNIHLTEEESLFLQSMQGVFSNIELNGPDAVEDFQNALKTYLAPNVRLRRVPVTLLPRHRTKIKPN